MSHTPNYDTKIKRSQLYLILLIFAVAGVLAIYQRTVDTDEVTLTNENEETVDESETETKVGETPRLLKLNGDTLEVYEPLVSSERIDAIQEPLNKNDDVSSYTLVGDKIFYKIPTEQTVAWMGFDRVEHRLAYTLTNNGNASIDGFVVSDDASKIAWSTSQLFEGPAGYTIEATLWEADLEDGVPVEVYATSFENQEAYLLPVRWSNDLENLYFSEQASGLGGYILFSGWHNLNRINLNTKYISEFGGGIYDISADETMLSQVDDAVKIIYRIGSNELSPAFAIPADEGFTIAGNVMFSPDGTKIAYNIAAGNPDEEKYRVIVSEIGGSEETIVINSNSFFPNVVRWLDNETLLLSDSAGYYIANIDGSWNAF